jgi:hypothetical protein
VIRALVVLVTVLLAGGALFMASRADEEPPRNAPATEGRPAESGTAPEGPDLPESSCEPGLSNCVVASGTVIFVEAVDPDGDGDAHFVTTSEDSVTAPGLTIFDVRADLRPEPLPEVGDLVGGAGPVFRGSRGQKQIEVTEFHVAR